MKRRNEGERMEIEIKKGEREGEGKDSEGEKEGNRVRRLARAEDFRDL